MTGILAARRETKPGLPRPNRATRQIRGQPGSLRPHDRAYPTSQATIAAQARANTNPRWLARHQHSGGAWSPLPADRAQMVAPEREAGAFGMALFFTLSGFLIISFLDAGMPVKTFLLKRCAQGGATLLERNDLPDLVREIRRGHHW